MEGEAARGWRAAASGARGAMAMAAGMGRGFVTGEGEGIARARGRRGRRRMGGRCIFSFGRFFFFLLFFFCGGEGRWCVGSGWRMEI